MTRNRLLQLGVLGFATILVGLCLHSGSVAALSGSDFDPSRIIDDSTFFSTSTMTTNDIQNFLNAKVPVCDTNGTQASTHSGYATRADWGRANGVPPPYTCLKDFNQSIPTMSADGYCGNISGGSKSAADIIFNVAQACGVSAQTLIVLLQKEQGLITDDWPWPIEYQSATGFGCPDSGACSSTYYGFFNQVYNAARQFRRYVAQPQNYNYAAGRTSYIAYSPTSSCGGANVTIQNQATAALYNYTPYQPNPAALANLNGSGDGCSSYGNRNFWRDYNNWFGPTTGNGFTRVISSDTSDGRQWILYGTIKQYIPDSQTIYAWGLQNTPLITMNASYLNSVSTGPNLQRLMRLNQAGNYNLYFVDGGVKHHIPWPQMINTWNLGGMVISSIPRDLFNLESYGSDLSYDVKDPNSSAIYALDGADTSGNTVIRQYQDTPTFNAWEGDNAPYTTLDSSSGFFSTISQHPGSVITSSKVSYGGNIYEAVNGSLLLAPNSATASLYPGTAQAISAATFSRMPTYGQATYFVQSVNDSAVYLIDNGVKHHVLWSNILKAWGGNVIPTTMVNNAFLTAFTTGSDLTSYGVDVGGTYYLMDDARINVPTNLQTAYRHIGPVLSASSSLGSLLPISPRVATAYILPAGDSPVYVLDNSGVLHHLEWASKVSAWGGYQNGLTMLSSYLVNDIAKGSSPSTDVSDGTQEYMLDNGQKWILPPSLKTTWGMTGSPQIYADGTLSSLPTAGTLTDKLRDSAGGYYYIRSGAADVSYDSSIGDVWGLNNGQVMSPSFVGLNFPEYMLTRFVQSSVPGDNRKFVVDNGNWYSLSDQQFANLGGVGAPIATLNPSNAPNTITPWTSVVVRSAAGSYYAIDGGTKRLMANPVIVDHWTNHGALGVPQVTNGFLNLLPISGTVERAIKGSAPAVYSALGATKYHILTSQTYNAQYAPYTQVTDSLINAMPTGNDIP